MKNKKTAALAEKFDESQIDELFEKLTGFPHPRDFQRQTILKLLQNREKPKGALLRAPTGSGKTETAIAPFLFAKQIGIEFPTKLIYIVPLRTLANSLRERTQKMIKRWEQQYPPKRVLVVTLQTGENPEDPRFEGDIIFCTIDQLLSSFLNIPYSVGRGSANVNAGVVFASYLVFDELHLLDPDRSFATTLKLLQQVIGISPFLLMTATLTHDLAEQIRQEVTPRKANPDDVLQLINVEGTDLAAIEGSRKRQFYAMPEPLKAESILQDIERNQRKRVIVICNTVAQSQALFKDLQDKKLKNIEITLLHSRFLPTDRKTKETKLQTDFAKGWKDDGKCHVLISTQVIEAGIDITCQVMHSQLCPMNSLLQRAGRCARFAGEEGKVYVYREIQVSESQESLVQMEVDDEAEAKKENRRKQSFLPYKDNICEFTWDALQEYMASQAADQAVGFTLEECWINRVHSAEDREQAGKRSRNRSEFETQFDKAVFHGKRSAAQHLIRFVDNRSIFMIEDVAIVDLEMPEVDLRQLQAFSLPRTTLCNIWREFLASHSQNWIFKKVVSPEDNSEDKSKAALPKNRSGESYSLPIAIPIKSQPELIESVRIIVNPCYADYDSDLGLRIGIDVEGSYHSCSKLPKPSISKEYSYHMDTYVGHLGRMWTCWQKSFDSEFVINGQPTSVTLCSVNEELQQAGGRFVRQKLFPEANLEETTALFELLVFLAVITHDLGKLQAKWQDVMRGWQKEAYKLYNKLELKPEFKISDPADHLLAHTDHHPEHPLFKQAYDDYVKQNHRPSHAVEGAFICFKILDAVLVPILETQFQADEEQLDFILHTVEMAAGRHHSAWAKGWQSSENVQPIQLHLQANSAIAQSWQRLSRRLSKIMLLPTKLPKFNKKYEVEDFELGKKVQPDDLKYQQLYWLIVRALRLCDGRSVQLH